jgi:hypothetical protein
MHFAPHALHNLALGSFTLDRVESELRELTEQIPTEDPTNLGWIKADPGASNHIPWALFIILSYFMILDCALGYRSWIEVVVALDSLSNPPLLILWLEIDH